MRRIILGLTIGAMAWIPNAYAASTVTGTPRADDIQGGNGPDLIYGLGGDDLIHGNKGPDVIYGNAGDDKLNGFGSGEAHDMLIGGPGVDKCVGTADDTYRGCELVVERKGLGPRR